MLVGTALLPLGVWLIHGSIDWFWEFPALSGPALGFLAMAGRLGPAIDPSLARAPARPRARAWSVLSGFGGAVVLVCAVVVLGVPYLAVREIEPRRDGQVTPTSPPPSIGLPHRATASTRSCPIPGRLVEPSRWSSNGPRSPPDCSLRRPSSNPAPGTHGSAAGSPPQHVARPRPPVEVPAGGRADRRPSAGRPERSAPGRDEIATDDRQSPAGDRQSELMAGFVDNLRRDLAHIDVVPYSVRRAEHDASTSLSSKGIVC